MDSYSDSSSSVDAEENAFYQELTRQILMLTDEDDDRYTVETRRRPVVRGGGGGSRPVARNYYSWSETVISPVPGWMESLWANGGGGTGVFIPSGVGVAAYGGGGGKKSSRRRRNNKVSKNNNNRGGGQKIHG
ncbi:unnamed protein product [Lactuca saligna]|uniref:Uncharacterized protein n=1 Tax=Lactuca saligna TaxID=75948 RepID=A0AA36EKI4_LACSI|nr:unnamed protein product [Lactuca saligna]